MGGSPHFPSSLFSSLSISPLPFIFCIKCCLRNKATLWSLSRQEILHHWGYSFILSVIHDPALKRSIVSWRRLAEVSPHTPEEGPFISLGWMEGPERLLGEEHLCCVLLGSRNYQARRVGNGVTGSLEEGMLVRVLLRGESEANSGKWWVRS